MLGANEVSEQTLDLLKGALGQPSGEFIGKSISTATGIVGYDLQAPAKNLYPVYTPLRNIMPRVGGGFSTATNWVQISSIVGSGFNNSPWVNEGSRAGTMSYVTSNVAAKYVTLGEEDSVTFEAVNAGKNFEDVKARMVARLLQKFFLKEENAIIGGNRTLKLGTPGTVGLTASGSGSSLTNVAHYVVVVALTQEGYYNNTVAGGIIQQKAILSSDGGTFYANGGCSIKSAQQTVTPTAGQNIVATIPAVNGAVAYAWFAGTSTGATVLQAITTVNSYTISALNTTNQVISAAATGSSLSGFSVDCSSNDGTSTGGNTVVTAFDGLMATTYNSSALGSAVVTNQGNATLTSSGRGSVVEIDSILRSLWDQYQLGPTVIYVNSQEQTNITNKVIGSGNAALIKYQNSGGASDNTPFAIVAGQKVAYYFNPYVPEDNMIPIRTHPKVPPGTILLYAEKLPMTYQNNEVTNVAEIRTRQDYHAIDWVPTSRKWTVGVYAEEVLAIYAPFALAMITNIANG